MSDVPDGDVPAVPSPTAEAALHAGRVYPTSTLELFVAAVLKSKENLRKIAERTDLDPSKTAELLAEEDAIYRGLCQWVGRLVGVPEPLLEDVGSGRIFDFCQEYAATHPLPGESPGVQPAGGASDSAETDAQQGRKNS